MAIPQEDRTRLAVEAIAEARRLRATGEETRADEVIRHAVHCGAWAVDMMDAMEAAAIADGPSKPAPKAKKRG